MKQNKAKTTKNVNKNKNKNYKLQRLEKIKLLLEQVDKMAEELIKMIDTIEELSKDDA